jgi:hypothetical protein
MPYRVVIWPPVRQKIAGWGLSDFVLVDVYLYLQDILPTDPKGFLRRAREPFDGLLFEFSLIDPENRLREHAFTFLVVYGQDEETLIIAKGGYQRRDGV